MRKAKKQLRTTVIAYSRCEQCQCGKAACTVSTGGVQVADKLNPNTNVYLGVAALRHGGRGLPFSRGRPLKEGYPQRAIPLFVPVNDCNPICRVSILLQNRSPTAPNFTTRFNSVSDAAGQPLRSVLCRNVRHLSASAPDFALHPRYLRARYGNAKHTLPTRCCCFFC